MLRFGHPGSLSYSCETRRAARRRFAPRQGSIGGAAILASWRSRGLVTTILHPNLRGQFTIERYAGSDPSRGCKMLAITSAIAQGADFVCCSSERREASGWIGLARVLVSTTRCPTGVAVLSWSYPHLP